MPSKEEIEEAKGWLAGLDVKSEYEAISKEIIFSCIEKNGETVYSEEMPLITDLEKQKIDSNLDDIVKEFTKALVKDKDMAIAQCIINIQNKKLEQLETEKTEVINYLKEEIDTTGSGKGMFLVKTALAAVLEKIEKGGKNAN